MELEYRTFHSVEVSSEKQRLSEQSRGSQCEDKKFTVQSKSSESRVEV